MGHTLQRLCDGHDIMPWYWRDNILMGHALQRRCAMGTTSCCDIGGIIYCVFMRPYHKHDIWIFNLCVAVLHDKPNPLLAAIAFSPYHAKVATSILLIHSFSYDLVPTHPTSAHPVASCRFIQRSAVPFLCTPLNPFLSLAPFCSLVLATFRLKKDRSIYVYGRHFRDMPDTITQRHQYGWSAYIIATIWVRHACTYPNLFCAIVIIRWLIQGSTPNMHETHLKRCSTHVTEATLFPVVKFDCKSGRWKKKRFPLCEVSSTWASVNCQNVNIGGLSTNQTWTQLVLSILRQNDDAGDRYPVQNLNLKGLWYFCSAKVTVKKRTSSQKKERRKIELSINKIVWSSS
jgi:hypothetical protein